MAILEAVISQQYQGQQVINRYYYVSSGTPAAVSLSFALLSAMGYLSSGIVSGNFPLGTLARAIQGVQHNSLSYVSAAARNVYSDTDFYENPYPGTVVGIQPGTATSPVLAYGYQSNRVRQSIRRGSKRYAGVTEEVLTQGGAYEAASLGSLEDIAAELSATLTYDDEGNTLTFVPAVVSLKPPSTPPITPSYTFWPTEAEQLNRTATGVLFALQPRVRTQVTRQYGRGV